MKGWCARMNKAFELILERLEKEVSLPKMNGMERRVGKRQTYGFSLGVRFAKQIVQEVAEEYTSTENTNCSTDTLTNADRIRSMSDDELAEFINHISRNCLMNALFSVNDEDCKHYEDCESCREAHKTVKEWLQSEEE